jgi:AAA domain
MNFEHDDDFYAETAKAIGRDLHDRANGRATKSRLPGHLDARVHFDEAWERETVCDDLVEPPAIPIPNQEKGSRSPESSSKPPLRTLTLPELEHHEFEYRRPILWRDGTVILREGYLAEVYASRGIGKTWLAQTFAYIAATAGTALGFHAEEPIRVLHIDGEMAGPELQERYGLIREKVGGAAPENLVVLAADWQDEFLPRLDTAAGRLAVEPFVEKADLIILDNRSTLFDPESEKDPVAWQPAQDWLLSLRRRRKAALVVHHSNRQGGARGHSKPEDVMNILIKLTRPEGYTADQGATFVLEFEKTRGVYGAAVAPFTASLTPTGWQVAGLTGEADHATRKLREYLVVAHRAGERPKSASRAISQAQVNRNAGFTAWAKLKDAGELRQHPEGGWFLG